MAITVTNRNFNSLFSIGDSFLKMNENSAVDYTCDLEFDFAYEASSDDTVSLATDESLKLFSSTWGQKGFVIGDSIDIFGGFVSGSNVITIDYSGTITDIIGDELVFSPPLQSSDLTPGVNVNNAINTVFPTSQGILLKVTNTSRSVPESMEFYFNLVENTSQGNPNSLIDGEVNRFRFEDVNLMTAGDSINAVQLGDKSGGAFGENITLTKASSGDKFELRVGFWNWLRYDQAQFTTEPSVYASNNSIKPYLKVEAYAQENNPNAILIVEDSFQLGNVGWIDENYNQGINNFTLTEYSNEDDLGNTIQGFDYGQPNNITVKVQTSNGTIDDKSILLIQHLPILGYKNNPLNFNQNTISAYSIATNSLSLSNNTFNKNGAELDITTQAISVSGNEITHTLRVVPNTDYKDYFDNQDTGDKFIKITIQAKSDGEDDATVVVAFQGQAEIQPPIGDIAGEVDSIDFYNHAMELDVDSPLVGNVDALTEDDFLCHSLMKFNKADNYEAFKVSFRVVNNSTGAFFDLFSRTINLNQYPTTNDGKILINYSENLGYQLPNPDRNILSLNFTGDEDATTYDVELKHTLLLSWRYWQAKPQALADFLDFALPNNGLNDEWVRYSQSGFSFIFRVELVKDGIADFFNSPEFFIDTYDSQSVTTVRTYEDLNGNSIPAPLSNQEFFVIDTHTAPSNWSIGDTWGWIAERPLENEPRVLNSTAWAYTSANLPLLPEQGETQSTLDITGNIAVIKTLCDGTQLPSNVTFVGRIQSPTIPDCKTPIMWMFKYMNGLSITPAQSFAMIIDEFRHGLVAEGICCADCQISDDPIRFGMAFGSFDVIQNDMPAIFQNEFCCWDIYEGDGGCTAAFDDTIDDLYAGIDGDLTEFDTPNQPTQVNPFFGANWEDLKNAIFNFTTDEELRYDMVSFFILNGLSIVCEGGQTTFKTIRVL